MSKNFKIYRASAGSGKTYTIALKYIAELLKNPQFAHSQILATTFTNDAAGEMKERILSELCGLIDGENAAFLENLQKETNLSKENIRKNAKIAYEAILDDYGNFNISTIDSFFQKILRNLARELGINSQFDIEMDINLPTKEAVKAVIANSVANTNIQDKIVKFLEHKLEDEKWNIQKDLESFAKNIFKEEFQRREKELQGQTEKIYKSIEECKKIKRDFNEQMCEFAESFSWQDKSNFYQGEKGVIGYFKKIRDGEYSEPNSYVNQVLCGDKCKNGDIENLELLKKTETYRSENIRKYNSAKLFLKNIHSLSLLEDISKEITNQNKEKNRFMLAKTNQLLCEIMGGTDTPFIYEKIGTNIKSIVIDEFQDTSTLQWKNFKPMLKNVLDENKFGMLVGDVKQSIYRWRNGDWKILNNIDNDENFAENAEFINLEKNWRSAENLVNFNNNLFENISKKSDCDIKKAYENVRQEINENGGFVSIDFVPSGKLWNTYETEDGENTMINAIAGKVKLLLENAVEQSDICILCREKKQIRKIAEDLPKILPEVKIISEEAYKFEASREISMIILALQIINEPKNPIPQTNLLLKWGKIKKEELKIDEIEKLTNELLDIKALSKLPIYDLVIKLCNDFKFNNDSKSADFLFAFMDKIVDYSAKNTNDISAFLEYWDEKLKDEALPMPTKKDDRRDGILLMTIHKSKGLEFHSVIVPFVDWSLGEYSAAFKENMLWCSGKTAPFDVPLIPIEYKKEMSVSQFSDDYECEKLAQNMDNLNVLYVALTRAAKNLLVLAKEKNSEISSLISSFIGAAEHYEIGVIEKTKQEEEESKKTQKSIPFNMKENKMEVGKNVDTQETREGKIIHRVFEKICLFDDAAWATHVENAVKFLVSCGEIEPENEEHYIEKVKNYIENSGRQDWFSGKYQVFNEAAILCGGKTSRPDRVLLDKSEKSAIIIDYKTGGENKNYEEQVRNYAKLLQKMAYTKVQGFVWYLEENKITEVEAK